MLTLVRCCRTLWLPVVDEVVEGRYSSRSGFTADVDGIDDVSVVEDVVDAADEDEYGLLLELAAVTAANRRRNSSSAESTFRANRCCCCCCCRRDDDDDDIDPA